MVRALVSILCAKFGRVFGRVDERVRYVVRVDGYISVHVHRYLTGMLFHSRRRELSLLLNARYVGEGHVKGQDLSVTFCQYEGDF